MNYALFRVITTCSCLLLCAVNAANAYKVTSDFASDTDGWTLVNGATMEYIADGGNPGGFVRGTDHPSGTIWYFEAPAKFLGNKLGAYNSLTYELRSRGPDSLFN